MSNPLSVINSFLEDMKKNRPDIIINDYYKYIVPIYKNVVRKSEDSIDLCGTGFFIRTEKNLFFLTCAHVTMECMKSEYKEILIPFFKQEIDFYNVLELAQNMFITNGNGEKKDKVDIFFAKIKPEYVKNLESIYDFFVKADCADSIRNIHLPRKLTAIGYPWTRNKVKKNKLLKSKLYTYTGVELSYAEIDNKRYSIASNILYHCKIKNIADDSELGSNKPKGEGISGGCIFDISEDHPIKLAGMIFEQTEDKSDHDSKIFVGLNIQTIWTFIDACEKGLLDN